MQTQDMGTKGATRQSWARASVRQFFFEIQRAEPQADHARLVRLMCDLALEDKECLRAAMDYIVTNFTSSQEQYKRATPAVRAAWAQQNAEQQASIKAQIMLLNLPMTNGKLARNCTGAELITIGGRWMAVGKKIGPRKILGQVLSEQQVRAFFQ